MPAIDSRLKTLMNLNIYAERIVFDLLKRAVVRGGSSFIPQYELQVTNYFVLLPLNRMNEDELEKQSGTHKIDTAE